MSSDVIIGHDGKPRCGWVGAGDSASARYHDEVWGTRTYDESAMFEALTLGVFEVGLSWSIVFGKRDAFREAFRGFDVAKVAAMTERDVDRLVLLGFKGSTQHRCVWSSVARQSIEGRWWCSSGAVPASLRILPARRRCQGAAPPARVAARSALDRVEHR